MSPIDFDALRSANEALLVPGVFDPLSARCVERLGFDAVYLGGWMTGAHLALTEPLLTLSEQVDICRDIRRAASGTIIADGGAGFGEPVHVRRAVREFAAAGVDAIHVEDQQFPKRAHYHRNVEVVVPRDEFVERMRTAVSESSRCGMQLIARTDAAKAVNGSVGEAVWRCREALSLGADAVMPLTPDGRVLSQVRAELDEDAPVMTLGGYLPGFDDVDAATYREHGFIVVLMALPGILVAYGAVRTLYAALARSGRMPATGGLGVNVDDLQEIRSDVEAAIGLPELYAFEERTLISVTNGFGEGE